MVYAKKLDRFNRFDVMLSTDNSEVSSILADQELGRKRKYQNLVEIGASLVKHHDMNKEVCPLCKFPRKKERMAKFTGGGRDTTIMTVKNRLNFCVWSVDRNVME